MKTAIYARFSSVQQEGGVSIETQLEICRKLAGDTPLEFIDRAQSGRTMHRTAFREMLAAAEGKKFDKLIVYKWDRFGRNAETHATIADLEDLGIAVSSATEGDDFLARGVGLLVSEDYSRKLSERVKDSMRVRFKQNHTFMGGIVPYGYRVRKENDLSYLEINPEEAAVVRTIFTLKSTKSIGARRIAKQLNDDGIKPRRAKVWDWSTVNKILRQELYTGTMTYGKHSEKLNRRSGKVTRTPNPVEDRLTHHDEKLRIISDETWELVAASLKKSRDYQTPKSVRPFSSLMLCGECGSVMYSRAATRPSKYKWLVCGNRDRNGKTACSNDQRPPEKDLLLWIQATIQRVVKHKDKILERAMELAKEQLDTSEARRVEIGKERAKVDVMIQKYSKMLRDGDNTEKEIKGLLSQIGELEGDRDTLARNLSSLNEETNYDRRKLLRELETVMEEANRRITDVTQPAELNSFLLNYLGQCTVYPDGSVVPEETGELKQGIPKTDGNSLVSGDQYDGAGARGIDSSAHRGAMSPNGGRTVAVLGSGVNVVYPPENAALFDEITRHGAVLSEYPIDTPPAAENFPKRNRIVSGMSRGVLVIEADVRSGALITARQAGDDHGRPVFALPGRVDNALSVGPHQLIRDGAFLTTHLEDILDGLGPLPQIALDETPAPAEVFESEAAIADPSPPGVLSDAGQIILEVLSLDPMAVDRIADRSDLEVSVVLRELTLMTLRGQVRRVNGQNYVRSR